MSRHRLGRLSLGLFIALASLLGFTATSHAALLTQSATKCPTPSTSQVFSPWADFSQYDLVPGGSFESGTPAWSLNGGATTVADNESFFVNASGDSQSLSLPAGAGATSPTFCVGVQNPTIRLFAKNSGNPASTLAVSVNFTTSLGLSASAPIGLVSADGSWQPTAPMAILVNLLTLLPNNQTPISLTFTPLGQGGNWQIDDVYVDPYGRT